MLTFRRIWAVLALSCGAIASIQCGPRAGYDSESHFLCAHDSDCTALGSDARCVVLHCVSSSASGSPSRSSAMSGGAGAADASQPGCTGASCGGTPGGSAATATGPD